MGEHENTESSRRSVGRRAVIGGGAALAVGSATVLAGGGTASASGNRYNAADETAIKQLSINYALGTDSVSAGNMEAAMEYYSRTFTDDAVISAGFDRAAPALVANGPEEWAGVVANAFVPYTATQHLLGTINVVFPSNRRGDVTMSSYLHATHVFRDSLDLLIVLGTYYDTVAQRRNQWRIVERFLQFTSFETTQRTAPPAATS